MPYDRDFLVRLGDGATAVPEIKGFEDGQTKAKHDGANHCVEAVNKPGRWGRCACPVHRNSQLHGKEMKALGRTEAGRSVPKRNSRKVL